MAKVRINKKNIKAKATRLISGALRGNKKLAEDMAEAVREEIRKGVKPGLKQITIEQRKELSKYNKTGKKYSPRKSNLTFTGQFLESFKGVFKKADGKLKYFVGPKGVHKAYRISKRKRGKGITNEEIGINQLKMGRDYKEVALKAKKKIARLIDRAIKRQFR